MKKQLNISVLQLDDAHIEEGIPAGKTSYFSGVFFRIVQYVLYDILRSRVVLGYMVFLALAALGLFNLSSDPVKGLTSLLNIVLIVIPLVSIVFATTCFYNAYEFIELLAAQPLRRTTIITAQFTGTATALCLAVLVGMGIPVLLFAPGITGLVLTGVALSLTLIFSAIAFLASVITRDKARGIGAALLLWFYFALLYDALVLFLMYAFADYPFEKAMLALTALNPVDLSRVLVLMQMDISALMGYTGALFREQLGSAAGMGLATLILLLWTVVPMYFAVKLFSKKDL